MAFALMAPLATYGLQLLQLRAQLPLGGAPVVAAACGLGALSARLASLE